MLSVVHGHVAEAEEFIDVAWVSDVLLLSEVIGEVGLGVEDVESAVVLADPENEWQLCKGRTTILQIRL